MKRTKLLAMVMTTAIAATGAVCAANAEGIPAEDLKVGAIYIGDENEGYTAAHMAGIDEMMEKFGLDESQVIEKTLIGEDETCYDASRSGRPGMPDYLWYQLWS